MKLPEWNHCTAEELWEYVAWHLAKSGIDTVLVGGGVVSIYSEGAYESGDLDLVIQSSQVKNTKTILEEIGFVQNGQSYSHPECKHLFIEFVKGPLAIGDDTNIKPMQRHIEGHKIQILSPTDCVRDRLASYIHFKSRDSLDQAILVAKRHPIDEIKVRRWCMNEGGKEQYEEFERRCKSH